MQFFSLISKKLSSSKGRLNGYKNYLGFKLSLLSLIAGYLFYFRRLVIKTFYHLLNAGNISLMFVASATRLVAPTLGHIDLLLPSGRLPGPALPP